MNATVTLGILTAVRQDGSQVSYLPGQKYEVENTKTFSSSKMPQAFAELMELRGLVSLDYAPTLGIGTGSNPGVYLVESFVTRINNQTITLRRGHVYQVGDIEGGQAIPDQAFIDYVVQMAPLASYEGDWNQAEFDIQFLKIAFDKCNCAGGRSGISFQELCARIANCEPCTANIEIERGCLVNQVQTPQCPTEDVGNDVTFYVLVKNTSTHTLTINLLEHITSSIAITSVNVTLGPNWGASSIVGNEIQVPLTTTLSPGASQIFTYDVNIGTNGVVSGSIDVLSLALPNAQPCENIGDQNSIYTQGWADMTPVVDFAKVVEPDAFPADGTATALVTMTITVGVAPITGTITVTVPFGIEYTGVYSQAPDVVAGQVVTWQNLNLGIGTHVITFEIDSTQPVTDVINAQLSY